MREDDICTLEAFLDYIVEVYDILATLPAEERVENPLVIKIAEVSKDLYTLCKPQN